MENLFFDLPENLQDKIIRMNPHPLTDLFDDFYFKYRSEVNKRNTSITKKQRKLWSRVYYNERDYYSMTLHRLLQRFELDLECASWGDEQMYYLKWCLWLEPRVKAIEEHEREERLKDLQEESDYYDF